MQLAEAVKPTGAGTIEAARAVAELARPRRSREITRADLERTGLYELLRTRGVKPGEVRRVVGGKVASPYEASVLKLAAGAPLIAMSRVMRDASGRDIKYGSHMYDATQYFLESDVSPGE
jgi:DNA-binding GntR family transcriptional regulator